MAGHDGTVQRPEPAGSMPEVTGITTNLANG
jgi:hypothetical protein